MDYPKIIEVISINTYTCQFCRKEFESKEDLEIIEGQSPLCSWICRYRLYFKILSLYDTKTLLYIAKLLNVRLKEGEAQENLASKLSKYFTNNHISNINQGSKAQTQKT